MHRTPLIVLLCSFLCGFAAGCQTTYAPAPDGRVSVIDLVLFPSAYAGQTVISHGYLSRQEDAATLYFDADHMARRGARLQIVLELSESAASAAERCAGQEVLIRGVVTQRGTAWVLTGVEDLVC